MDDKHEDETEIEKYQTHISSLFKNIVMLAPDPLAEEVKQRLQRVLANIQATPYQEVGIFVTARGRDGGQTGLFRLRRCCTCSGSCLSAFPRVRRAVSAWAGCRRCATRP